jgi:hypothetical protein
MKDDHVLQQLLWDHCSLLLGTEDVHSERLNVCSLGHWYEVSVFIRDGVSPCGWALCKVRISSAQSELRHLCPYV